MAPAGADVHSGVWGEAELECANGFELNSDGEREPRMGGGFEKKGHIGEVMSGRQNGHWCE